MTAQNIITERRKLRLKLLSNGYTPLPLRGKGIYITGWSIDTVDEAWLDQHARNADYLNTGLRCDRLIAFDIDVLDVDIAEDIEKAISEEIGETDLCRIGLYPKRLLLYRLTGDPGKSMRTGKYGDHRVELLCGPGHQFAAYGKHPSGCDYQWDFDIDPVITPFDNLPACSHDEAQRAMDACEQVLQQTGLKKQSNAYAKELNERREEFDLKDDFEILLKVGSDGRQTTWGELKETLDEQGVFGNIKREDGEFGDSNGVHFLLADVSGQPCGYDFVRDVIHREPLFDIEKLTEALTPTESAAPSGKSMFTPKPYTDLLEQWVYVLHDGSVRDIDEPQRVYKLKPWVEGYQHVTLPAPTKKDPYKTMPATTAWIKDPQAMRADYAAMCPNSDQTLVKANKRTIFNTYSPPKHATEGGEIETVQEFIEHLIPDATERNLFWDWHAIKVLHPDWRMHGLIMVTETYGTGRGTWNEILRRLFGATYVRNISLGDLIGNNSQAVYNAFLADSLIVTVPEALEEKEESSTWKAKHVAYERLKLLIEPQPTTAYIKRKYGSNIEENVYASVLISTNHRDGIAIDAGDRRLIVIENADIPLIRAANNLQARIHKWKLDPANIGALHRALQIHATRATYDPYAEPMMTDAKETMIKGGRGTINQAFDYVLENAPGDLMTHKQWLVWVKIARAEMDLEWPYNEKTDGVVNRTLKERGFEMKGLSKSGQVRIGKARVRPWILRNRSKWERHQDNTEIKEEVLKNGDPMGANLRAVK